MSIERFQALVAEIGALTGVGDMAADDQGYIALSFDDRVLHLQYDLEEDRLVLFTRLQEVEGDRAEQIYLMLLGANLFWQGAKGATFSVEPASGSVFLMDRRAFGLARPDTTASWIGHFHAMAEYWNGRIVTANAGGSIDDPDAPAGPSSTASSGSGNGLSEPMIRV